MLIVKYNTRRIINLHETYYKINVRSMHRATNAFYYKSTRLVPHIQVANTKMSTLKSVKLKKKAVTDLANDGNGAHTHIAEEECVKTDCKPKQCTTLCDKPKVFSIKGHNTHSQPIGRFHRKVADEDAHW